MVQFIIEVSLVPEELSFPPGMCTTRRQFSRVAGDSEDMWIRYRGSL